MRWRSLVDVSFFWRAVIIDHFSQKKGAKKKQTNKQTKQTIKKQKPDSESPTACSEEIIDLVSWAKSAAPGTEVVLSSLTARSDDDQLATQVEEVNSNLKQFCRQNKWKMIVHSNITAEHHLNRSGLHLNKVGTSRLARNFLDFLKNKD